MAETRETGPGGKRAIITRLEIPNEGGLVGRFSGAAAASLFLNPPVEKTDSLRSLRARALRVLNMSPKRQLGTLSINSFLAGAPTLSKPFKVLT